ncbi:MAG: ABC transporter ATP-binding protein [Desulfobacterales bacterium]|nr:MAG: ABC transporter ATP-binding protein [Desulfobacterales bacterium]
MALTNFIEARRLQYAYLKNKNNWALNQIDLDVHPSEYLLICGASGSGKSTLCRTFNGLIPHFYQGVLRGQVTVAGTPTTELSVADLFARVAMVFQNPEAQLFNRSVEMEIAFGLESVGLPRAEIKRRIAESTDLTGLTEFLPRNPHALSSGEQQLVAITAMLALRPRIIVLDEPYANLDPSNVRRVRNALKALHQQQIGIVVCEHRLPYTLSDAQRMVAVKAGAIVLNGPPAETLLQNIQDCGLEMPLAPSIGHRLAIRPLPLDVKTLEEKAAGQNYPIDLKPELLPPFARNHPVVLEVQNVVSKLGESTILQDVSFTLSRGECLAIVGANGAGKTTLLKHLIGLQRPSRGQIRVMGQDSAQAKVSQLARYVGVAFQNPDNQFFKLTVWDEITVGAKALNRYDPGWLQELVELFRLEPLLNRSPYRLSGGEKKRVAFAAALAGQPAILALDEPTAGQDYTFRRALGRILTQLRERGQAIVLVTHDLSFAERYAHRWLLLAEGRVVVDGRPWEVMSNANAMQQASLEPTDAFRLYARGHA